MEEEQQFVSQEAFDIARKNHLGIPKEEYRARLYRYIKIQIACCVILLALILCTIPNSISLISDYTKAPFSLQDFQYIHSTNLILRQEVMSLTGDITFLFIVIVGLIRVLYARTLRAIVCPNGLIFTHGKTVQVIFWEQIVSLKRTTVFGALSLHLKDQTIVVIDPTFSNVKHLRRTIEKEFAKHSV